MIALILLFLSILDVPGGAKLVYALENVNQAVTRVELPTYYLIFILLGIVLITWGIMEIFSHADHDR